jgi:hypothetical protein
VYLRPSSRKMTSSPTRRLRIWPSSSEYSAQIRACMGLRSPPAVPPARVWRFLTLGFNARYPHDQQSFASQCQGRARKPKTSTDASRHKSGSESCQALDCYECTSPTCESLLDYRYNVFAGTRLLQPMTPLQLDHTAHSLIHDATPRPSSLPFYKGSRWSR